MNDVAAPATWLDANHRYLCAEFSRLQGTIDGPEPWDDLRHGEVLKGMRAEMQAVPAIDMLAAAFGLTAFERDVLLLAAGVEMNPDLAQVLAERSASALTFGAALALLREPHWSALSPARPLRRWGLVNLASESTPVRSRLHVDERVLLYLVGVNPLDARLDHLVRPGDAGEAIAPEHAATAARIAAHLRRCAARGVVIQLVGDDTDGQEQVAAHAVAELGLSLLVLHADDLPAGAADRMATARLAVREGVLLDSAWMVRVLPGMPAPCAAAFVDALAGPVFVSATEALPVRRATRAFRVARPGSRARLALWQSALGSQAHSAGIDLDAAAAQHHWSARSIERAAQRVRECLDAGDPGPVALREGCRAGGPIALDDLAQRLDPAATWNDLVLPGEAEDALREIAGQVRNRLLVHDEWGMGDGSGRGLGITVLFAGEPGTGKTMAAEVLANELALDLYRIDLSTVVSKYVGETEKNLKRVFDAAEASGAILLFDEADALFGRRSEVKDSHDRYANIEVSYLLQRMEAYDGLAILTTNAKASMDRAFQRRLRFFVHFPFPDAAQRERLWRAAFPPATPTQGLDISRLAALRVAGGGVRNIALNAAFRAARDRRAVGMRDLLAAARSELAKSDKPLTEAETRGWV